MSPRRFVLSGVVGTLVLPFAVAAAQLPALPAAAPHPQRLPLTTTSDAAKAHFDSGYTAINRGNPVLALAQFEKAVAADTNFVLARAFRARYTADRNARDEVERLAVRYMGAISPTYYERLLLQAVRAELNADPIGARNLLQATWQLVEREPNLRLDYSYTLAAPNASRTTMVRRLMEADSSSATAHAALALALANPADSVVSATAATTALRLAPREPMSHYAMAQVAMRARRWNDATTHLQHALSIDPTYYGARFMLARAELYQQRPAQARALLETSLPQIRHAEHRAEHRRLIALTHLHEGNIERARTLLEDAARLAEADTRKQEAVLAHRHLAYIAGLRRDEAAIGRHIAEQDRLGRVDLLHEYWATLSWTAAGKLDKARASLARYEDEIRRGLTPDGIAPQAARGTVMLAEGKTDAALERFAAAPGNFFATLGRYEGLVKLGRRAEADQALKDFFAATNYDVFGLALPTARYRYGKLGVK